MNNLRSEQIKAGDELITLFELSALSRIEYLEYVAAETMNLPDVDSTSIAYQTAVINNGIRDCAMVVAFSLSQNDYDNRNVPAMAQQLLRDYPLNALSIAAYKVRELSGMLESAKKDNGQDNNDEVQEQSLEKS